MLIALDKRPFCWEDIVGQKTIVSEFKKRSVDRDWPSIMIFAGESGTGKTTIACMVAALISDENPIPHPDGYFNPNPDSLLAKSIISERFNRDTSFYDASKMSKDDVIALEELVSTDPMFDANRVVIIDEAQELSRHSKGVVLKLLEKKRKNVYIILCTMNADAFDKSIRSRGLFYTFRSPSSGDIARALYNLATEIKGDSLPTEFIEQGVFTIADNCEGSVRMAVQTLERCLKADLYTEEAIMAEFGMVSNSKMIELVLSLLKGDTSKFSEIKAMDPKEFFYASYKIISEALVYFRTGYTEASWKADSYKGLLPLREDLAKLFSLYSEIDSAMGAYFKPSYFLARVTSVYENKPAAPAVRSR